MALRRGAGGARQGCARRDAGRALARPFARRLRAPDQWLLGLDRLARRADPDQPALHRRLRRAGLATRTGLRRGGLRRGRPAEERTCPDVQAEVLVAIADVTAPIFAAGTGKLGEDFARPARTRSPPSSATPARGDPRFRCQVISFYQGGQFKVYKYRRYADVRLVFAPEFDAAWFGGDPDNFNFPRYDLDCAFLRLYENGKPAATPDFLAWSNSAPQAGDPVFVSGNPGVTERRLTVAQLEALRDVSLPLLTLEMAELRGRLQQLAEQGPAMRRVVASDLFETENTYKVLAGPTDRVARSGLHGGAREGRDRPEGASRDRSEAGGRDRRSLEPDRRRRAGLRAPVRGLARAGGRRRRRLGPLPLRPRTGQGGGRAGEAHRPAAGRVRQLAPGARREAAGRSEAGAARAGEAAAGVLAVARLASSWAPTRQP